MSDESRQGETPHERVELDAAERRVLGTLIEKQLSTPDYYPMTTKALVAGCNQKNARDPVTQYGEDDIRSALSALQGKRMVLAVKIDTGHATRWRHELDRKWGVQGRETAVLAELLLRGPQTEGELRSHAGRLRPLPDLEALHETIARLAAFDPPLVVRLSREGAVRGVRFAHGLYPQAEMDAVVASDGTIEVSPAVATASGAPASEVSQLRRRLAELESRLARVETLLNDELGASFPATEGEQLPGA